MNPTDLPPRGGEESLPYLEVGGVVDGGLGAQPYPFIVILVDPLVLVVGVTADGHALQSVPAKTRVGRSDGDTAEVVL
jgi:hypothetical protein